MDIHKNARLTPHSRAELVRRVLEGNQTRAAVNYRDRTNDARFTGHGGRSPNQEEDGRSWT